MPRLRSATHAGTWYSNQGKCRAADKHADCCSWHYCPPASPPPPPLPSSPPARPATRHAAPAHYRRPAGAAAGAVAAGGRRGAGAARARHHRAARRLPVRARLRRCRSSPKGPSVPVSCFRTHPARLARLLLPAQVLGARGGLRLQADRPHSSVSWRASTGALSTCREPAAVDLQRACQVDPEFHLCRGPLTRRRRVFLLGPSHHFYSKHCLLSPADAYATPLGARAAAACTPAAPDALLVLCCSQAVRLAERCCQTCSARRLRHHRHRGVQGAAGHRQVPGALAAPLAAASGVWLVHRRRR